MSKLQHALAWAARGFRVFPLWADAKEPVHSEAWYDHATTDTAAIRTMWTDPVLGTEYDYNIGCDCTDMVVVDIDVKNGKDGYNEYAQLGGSFDTLVVRTPTGGYHCYFEGPDSANTNIARSIEIRSHHGYVVAPGSTIMGKDYYVENDVAPAWITYSIETKLRAPDIRKELQADIGLDSAANVQAAINYLQTTPVAVEGQRGDETTYITAARLVRELGLSPGTAFELMRDHWNERCQPPWQLDELAQKVENAARYGTADLGRLDPSILFAGVSVEPPPSILAQSPEIAFGNAFEPALLRPRPWLIDRMLMMQKMTLIGSAGSAGKSTVALAIAAHLALGIPFGQYKVHRAGKVVVYNGEDDLEEQSRRLLAICSAYNLDYNVVSQRVMLLSYEELDLKLALANGRNVALNEPVVTAFMQIISDPEVICAILDPFVDVHTCEEADSVQMNVVMRILQNMCVSADVAMLLMHHTSKAGGDRQEARIGNMDIFRGSSAIVNKCRIAFTLMDASSQDAEDYGLQDHERHQWVRMDDAKMNLSLRGDATVWFRRMGVKIITGDAVGVLHAEELTKSKGHLRMRLADLLIKTMAANGTGSMQIPQAIAVIKSGEPLYANKRDSEIKQNLEAMLVTPVQVREHRLSLVRQPQEGRGDRMILTME